MLKYTGHPLVDVGAATIAAFVGKSNLASITEADLDKVADFIEREYARKPLKAFLTVAFTSNSWFAQYGFESQPEKRADYAKRLLRGYRSGTPKLNEKCVFTGYPAVGLALSDKLPLGRAFRQHIPMLTGEDVINFHPGGDPGVPVSGEALLCIQTFPLGCAKCAGRLLAVHSDNEDLMFEFADEFWRQNQQALLLAHQQDGEQLKEASFSTKTLLVKTLLDIQIRREEMIDDLRPCSVTAYHLNNGKSVALDIYHLPLELIEFLSLARSPKYHSQWTAIAQSAWHTAKPKSQTAKEDEEDNRRKWNSLYEDLFGLPSNAREFVRKHLLRTYSFREEIGLVSWKLTRLFLEKVMRMNRQCIDEIEKLGDRLADYIVQTGGKDFFRVLSTERRYDYFRTSLLRADRRCAEQNNHPLITLEQFYQVFEAEQDGILMGDRWKWGRDLMVIRIIERLVDKRWLATNADLATETLEEQETAA